MHVGSWRCLLDGQLASLSRGCACLFASCLLALTTAVRIQYTVRTVGCVPYRQYGLINIPTYGKTNNCFVGSVNSTVYDLVVCHFEFKPSATGSIPISNCNLLLPEFRLFVRERGRVPYRQYGLIYIPKYGKTNNCFVGSVNSTVYDLVVCQLIMYVCLHLASPLCDWAFEIQRSM